MVHARFFDQVLHELSAGNMQDGINLLVGMLDTVDQRPEHFGAACDELQGHPLAVMLREDPLFAASPASPGNDAAMLRLIATGELAADVSPTGKRLFAATSRLKLSRALRGRRLTGGERLSRAWQQGRRICALGGGILDAAQQLAGRDIGNITVVEDDRCLAARLRSDFGESFALIETGPVQFLRSRSAPRQFDVICSVELADTCAPHALAALVPAMRRRLAPGGTISLAALATLHAGRGWRRAYLDWEPACHEEEGLAATAAAAGLGARVFHDETSCIVWCEMGALPISRAVSFAASQAGGAGHD